ncbi:uncharacterized protein PHALS_12298 [Plasmopara halstedii]|uniref:Uncharacterized protein n=1 Tax=Plasmopara halstedii TaxID=4781 RepID=A0A0P1AL20_PLAHL|nr:uncharacterized protein PHALS_12298 [Plasmopara halstedii]CEG41991.1 hypothetical protein PHALS_12298 [Plasmopara halstedii]|eukprot:XP_024578360.1 hypothetical protein PHALS_12298 [Plasmopara halstedii]
MDASKAKGEWNALWTMMLTESQEDQRSYRHKEQHGIKRKKNGDHDHGIMLSRNLSSSLSRHSSINQDYAKRARQVATTSTDLSESGKGINSRQSGRFFKNASKGSKLMQKMLKTFPLTERCIELSEMTVISAEEAIMQKRKLSKVEDVRTYALSSSEIYQDSVFDATSVTMLPWLFITYN